MYHLNVLFSHTEHSTCQLCNLFNIYYIHLICNYIPVLISKYESIFKNLKLSFQNLIQERCFSNLKNFNILVNLNSSNLRDLGIIFQ